MISKKMCRKYDKDIMLILDTYRIQRRQFIIGKSYVPFTANDISLIFGIPNGARALDLKYGNRNFLSSYLGDSRTVIGCQLHR